MKKLLVVVDYQNDFVDGSLGFDQAKKIENNIEQIIEKFVEEKNDIVFTLDSHDENYLETIEGKNLPKKHGIINTEGWQIFGKIKKLARHGTIIKKDTFGAKNLGKFLENKQYSQVEIVGVVTHMCVLANAIIVKTWLPNTEIIVHKSAVADFDFEMEKKCIDLLKSIHIKVK